MTLMVSNYALFDNDINDVPVVLRSEFRKVVALLDEFCEKQLTPDYQILFEEAAIVACECELPINNGARASWAAGIVHAVGWLNFLLDPSQEPYLKAQDVADWFGVSEETMIRHSEQIHESLGPSPATAADSRPETTATPASLAIDACIADLCESLASTWLFPTPKPAFAAGQ